jgi:hypothetical protein
MHRRLQTNDASAKIPFGQIILTVGQVGRVGGVGL